jgi:immune inhibitor A
MDSRRAGIAAGAILLIVALLGMCSCCLCGMVGWLSFASTSNGPTSPKPPRSPWGTSSDPTPQATAPLTTTPPPNEAEETLRALEAAIIPEADLHELGIRFLGVPDDTPRIASTENADFPVGTTRTFQASNLDTNETFELEAELVYKTDHLYMWVEVGLNANQRDIEEAADLFEEHTYPTTRAFFGSEWTPGVDGDPHLSILHAKNLGRTVAGYFSSADSYVQAVRQDSNEMEMFYIHVDRPSEVGDPFYNGVLAHEFQHMIHWNNDRNETTWLNEGCSELAMEINNRTYPGGPGRYDVGGSEYAYLDDPDTQLNTWPEVGETGSAAPHYGASYLFMSYFLDRFGETATKALVSHDENGMTSVDAVLDELNLSITHQDVFADWVIANLIDDSGLGDNHFGYNDSSIPDPRIDARFTERSEFPLEHRTTVSQYAVDYIEIQSRHPLTLAFTGSTQAQLLATDAHSGQYLWWSNRADESNPKLTRRIDLTGVSTAELGFWSWYHIEEDWDYAYVVVGTTPDGRLPSDLNAPSIDWQILDDRSLGCTTSNPNNGNLGCGLTGKSDDWSYRTADLTPFTGQEIALRFEYVTDAAVNQAGLALDDIEVTADGTQLFLDNAESSDSVWVPEGFVRHANVLPQAWLVQLVMESPAGMTVEQWLTMDERTSGIWVIPFTSEHREATIAVSALAPVTTEPAAYEIRLTEAP